MRFPWVSVVFFLVSRLSLDSVDAVFGAALPQAAPPSTQTRTVPFRIARGAESLPAHHVYVVDASVAGVPFEVCGRNIAHTSTLNPSR